MPADQLRNRTVGSKMTESEYEQMVAAAERESLTLGEWCREVLLARVNTASNGNKAHTPEQALLAEVMALRMILLNVFFRVAQKEELSVEGMERLIQRVDGERFARAQERLSETVIGGGS